MKVKGNIRQNFKTLSICNRKINKQVLLQAVKTQMKCNISSGSTLFVMGKKIF